MSDPTSKQRVLDPMKFGAYTLSSARAEVSADVLSDQLMHRFEALVLSDHIADDTYAATTWFKFPTTTWQMFKSRHASSWWLGWLVRRRPVQVTLDRRTVEVEVKRYLLYPEANLVSPSLGRPVIYETTSERWDL